jgi:hypothetical protein
MSNAKRYTDRQKLDGDLALSWWEKLALKSQQGVWALDALTSNFYLIKTYKGKQYIVDEDPKNKVWGNVYSS